MPEFDNLYIDLSPIIRRCCHQFQCSNAGGSSTEIIHSIFNELCHIVRLVKPKKILYLSIDGVSPAAKHHHIRQQTFLTTFNRSSSRHKLDDDSPDKVPFDRNCVIPGTEWMEQLNKELELFIRRQVTENTVWQRLTIIYDDHLSPGEATFKIMQWIRSEKCSHDCDPNIRYQSTL